MRKIALRPACYMRYACFIKRCGIHGVFTHIAMPYVNIGAVKFVCLAVAYNVVQQNSAQTLQSANERGREKKIEIELHIFIS